MSLSKEAIKEFKEIYKHEFGEEISDDKAQELGQGLIALFKIICRPIPDDNRRLNNNDDQRLECPSD